MTSLCVLLKEFRLDERERPIPFSVARRVGRGSLGCFYTLALYAMPDMRNVSEKHACVP